MKPIRRNIAFGFEKVSRLSTLTTWTIFVFTLIFVEYVDYVTGPDLDVCFLLMIPTFLLAWRFGVVAGCISSCITAFASIVVNYGDQLVRVHPSIAWLNVVTLTIYLMAFAVVIHALRVEMEFHEKLARTDALTGLLNRRAFDEVLHQEMNRLTRFKRPFTLLALDLDKFKWVNDTKGHVAGDELLKSLARVLMGSFRDTDFVARLGGDEFGVILPETDEETALGVIVKLEENIRGMSLASGFPISASIGMVTNPYPPMSQEKLIEEADRRMYQDKSLKQKTDHHT